MLCLLEGPDGGGKSTLAQQLASMAIATIIHTGAPDPPGRCPFTEYEASLDAEPLASRVTSASHLVILDRWHAGEAIYGPLYRGTTRYTPAGMLHTEMVLDSLGAVKIMCLPPLETVQERIRQRGDSYIDQRHLPQIWDAYLRHAEEHRYSLIGNRVESTALAVLLTARGRHTLSALLAAHSARTYTGSLAPSVIFAGDQGNTGPRGRRDLPRPFTPLPGSSGEWLLDALIAGKMAGDCGIVNVNHRGVDVNSIHELAGRPRWVALGGRASRTLSEKGIPHAAVPHPSYAKRFTHGRHHEYTLRLREAAGFADLKEESASGDHGTHGLGSVPDAGRAGARGAQRA